MATHTPYAEPLPPHYQEQDAEYVFRFLYSGESCALVGIGSVGKSNLLHFLMREETKQKYLQNMAPYLLMVLLDPHKLVHLQQRALEQAGSAWAGYEIMLSRLRRTLVELDDSGLLPRAPNSEKDLIDLVESYYLNLFDAQPLLAQTGIRQLEDAVYQVLKLGPQWRIVFLFDEFEGFRGLPPQFFESLRGVRDEFKQRVMYVTTSRRPLDEIAADWYADDPRAHDIMEGFTELFNGFTRYIGLLDRESAEAIIRRLEKRYGYTLELPNKRALLDATGKHAGLLRRSFLQIISIPCASLTLDQVCDALLTNRGILQECGGILESLSAAEHRCIWKVAHGRLDRIDSDAWHSLSDKYLVDVAPQGHAVLTLPVLRRYLMARPEPAGNNRDK